MRRRAAQAAHPLFGDRLRFRLAAELSQQLRLPHARLGAGIILADIGVIDERFVIAPALLQGDGVKKMAVGGAKIGPAAQQFLKRGDRRRGLLYGAIGVGLVTVAAKPRMWETGFGEFVWFVLIGLVVYTFVALYRYSRSY